MADKFTFASAGEIQMVEFALARNGYSHELVSALATGDRLNGFREVLLGNAAIVPVASGNAAPTAGPAQNSDPLLVSEGTVETGGSVDSFVVRDHFVVNKKKTAPVKISCIWDNFQKWFMGKTESSFAASSLAYGKLSRVSVDGLIIEFLGGEEKAETTLAEVFALMAVQPNGEEGALLTSGRANIFYVRDVAGALRAVSVLWDGDGWDVGATAVTNPNTWSAGDRVFSRNSR
ncbi:MAG: hypothetical protein P4L67_03930 [Candidatus Pacebacteria bacterium]|nr:hypothetical protein [Candidatus Paceibacterota bacterium]